MSQKPQIAIPKRCHENWDAMAVVDKRRFCASCEKHVHDFTKSSDREIIAKFKSDGNLCGRFLDSQLNRDLIAPKEKSFQWMIAASGVLGFLGIGNVQAQVKQDTVQTDDKRVRALLIKSLNVKLMTGTIIDSTGPLPGANVFVKGHEEGTQTDIDGKFSIRAKEGDTIVGSYVGMKDAEIIVGLETDYNMQLGERDSYYLITMGAYIIRRTFFGRIFHSIGNIFK